jgi:hypothetical protein
MITLKPHDAQPKAVHPRRFDNAFGWSRGLTSSCDFEYNCEACPFVRLSVKPPSPSGVAASGTNQQEVVRWLPSSSY